jgi:glucose/mannose-6-phosphate isomerase
LHLCEKWGIVGNQDLDSLLPILEAGVETWDVSAPFDRNPAKQIAQALHGKVGAIYGLGPWQGRVAYRWRCQIAENAKNLSLSHAFPELDHNDILGWEGARGQNPNGWTVVVLEDQAPDPRMALRAKVTGDLIGDAAAVLRAHSMGATLVQKMLSLTLLGDFVSLYLAALNGVDPETTKGIIKLKEELAKLGPP